MERWESILVFFSNHGRTFLMLDHNLRFQFSFKNISLLLGAVIAPPSPSELSQTHANLRRTLVKRRRLLHFDGAIDADEIRQVGFDRLANLSGGGGMVWLRVLNSGIENSEHGTSKTMSETRAIPICLNWGWNRHLFGILYCVRITKRRQQLVLYQQLDVRQWDGGGGDLVLEGQFVPHLARRPKNGRKMAKWFIFA